MTYEKALDMLNLNIDKSNIGNINRPALYTALQALEKQIPKKAHISLHGTTDWNTKCRCPVCRKDVFGTQKYCGNCGQALDWGGAL